VTADLGIKTFQLAHFSVLSNMDALEFLLAETPDSDREDAQAQSTDDGVREWESICAVAAVRKCRALHRLDVQL
jgi:hypothetical protein